MKSIGLCSARTLFRKKKKTKKEKRNNKESRITATVHNSHVAKLYKQRKCGERKLIWLSLLTIWCVCEASARLFNLILLS